MFEFPNISLKHLKINKNYCKIVLHFEAIHNKDYSVVKTLKAGQGNLSRLLFIIDYFRHQTRDSKSNGGPRIGIRLKK